MYEVCKPLIKQPSKNITSIGHITPQECATGRWIELGHVYPLPRMVCDVQTAPVIHTGIDTPLSWIYG